MAGADADAEYDTFSEFTATLDDPNISPEKGLEVIRGFVLVDMMLSREDMMTEWHHWYAAAGAAAALNEGSPRVTEEEVYTVAAKYVLLDSLLATPRYNMCISMMHFTMHQLMHAFGRIHDLPYPHSDGSRTYNDPSSALEEAFGGKSVRMEAVEGMWKDFLRCSSERAGLNVDAILGDDDAAATE